MEPTATDVPPLEPEHNSLPMALLAGSVAALLGAVVWAVFTIVTDMQLGAIAILIGFLVGYAVRVFGKGSDPTFQVLGAVLSLVGVIAGNVLTVCVIIGRQADVSLLTVLGRIKPEMLMNAMVETFSPMDLAFYAIAVYEGYKFSRAPVPPVARVPGLNA